MDSRLRYTGVAAVVVSWSTLLTAAAISGFDLLGSDPLSYMGTDSRSAFLFTVGLAVPALLLTAFHFYVKDRYQVGRGFSLAMLGGLAGQMVAAFVDIGGNTAAHRIHTNSALVLGISLPLLMWRFAAGQPEGTPWRRLTYRLFWAEAAACVIGLYLSSKSIAPVAEIIPGAVFHIWIFTVTLSSTITLSSSGHRQCNHPANSGDVAPSLPSDEPEGIVGIRIGFGSEH